METGLTTVGLIGLPLLYGACFVGLAYTLLRALREGAQSYAEVYAVDTARQFEDLFLFIPPRRIVDLTRVAAITFFIAAFLLAGDFQSVGGMVRGVVVGVLAAGAALISPRLIVRVLKARRLQRFNLQLVDALLTMSNALRAGFSILQAFESVVKERQNPIAQEFGVFLQQTRVGVRFEDALESLDKRVGSEDLTLMVVSIVTARQTGGNLTEVFEKIAATIRERMRIEGRIRSLTAQGRLQGIIVGATPLFLAFALTALDPQMMMAFFTSTIGISMLIVILILEAMGALVIRRIIRIDI
ncbi:MAG: type II secretion system F family protein [Kiritimatiellae bacterium]|nr:type II secretion system F family protein [Kiritimatiellia bacterium]